MSTEAVILSVVGSLAALFLSIGVPVIKLNTTIQKFCDKVEFIDEELEELTTRNSKSHDRIWRHNDKQDSKLEEHDKLLIKHEHQIKGLQGGSKNE